MFQFFKRLFGIEDNPLPQKQSIQTTTEKSINESASVTFLDLISECCVSDGESYTLKPKADWNLRGKLDREYAFLFRNLKENIHKLDDKEIEQVYYLCLVAGKVLYDIEPTYYLMVKAYKKFLKDKHNSFLSGGNGLFLFGFDNKFKINPDQKYDEYREYCFFLIANPDCHFEVVSYRSWMWRFRYKQPFIANEICLPRISQILRTTIRSVKQQEKYMMWQAYFVLLLNPSPISQDTIEFVESIKTKSKQFKKQLERIDAISKDYQEDNDRHYWYKITLDDRLLQKQIKLELQGQKIPELIKPLGLVPTSFNWRFSVEFSTGDFSKCKENHRPAPGLTNKDAILGLHISAGNKWVVDLQWYLPSEKAHYIREASHDRPRIMWRNMYQHPISYQPSLKERVPDFQDVHNFPELVNQMQEIFSLDFKKQAVITVKGLKVEDKIPIEKWLSPCVNNIVFENA